MENDPLIPKANTSRKKFQSLLSPRTLNLRPLPEEDEEDGVFRPSTPTVFSSQHQTPPSSFKEWLIFGDAAVDVMCRNSNEPLLAQPVSSSSSPTPTQMFLSNGDSSAELVSSDNLQVLSSSDCPNLRDPSAQSENRDRYNIHKSVTAPNLYTIDDVRRAQNQEPTFEQSSAYVIRLTFVFLVIYLVCGVLVYIFAKDHFCSEETFPVVDALYFSIVTMCTVGYGDITPQTNFAKIFSIFFVLIGFGFIHVLLTSMVTYILDLQENLLLRTANATQFRYGNRSTYLVDVNKGRMRIRMKVITALVVVLLCIALGTVFLHVFEKLGWFDSFYLSVMSVTTVGYGDHAFSTTAGRLFASVWLLLSSLMVARAFMFLAEARIDKRHREIARLLLEKVMTVSDFLSADTDQDGFVSKSEFVVYKLKQMGRITELDIEQICAQFQRLDTSNLGRITRNDLVEAASH